MILMTMMCVCVCGCDDSDDDDVCVCGMTLFMPDVDAIFPFVILLGI